MKFITLRLLRNEKGSVTVLIALVITALLGMAALVLDLGLSYYESVELQNAADAAVLAAAWELPAKTTRPNKINDVKDKAIEYAQKNGLTITRSDVQLTQTIDNEYRGVAVTAQKTVNYSFARVLGINSGNVIKSSEAWVGGLVSAVGIVPLGFDYNDCLNATEGQTFIIKEGAHSGGGGWRGIVELDGDIAGGASDYEDWLANGYDGEVTEGDTLPVQNGNISGPTIDAVNDERVTQCTDTQCAGTCSKSDATTTYPAHQYCTHDHYIIGCPRVIVTPVIEVIDPTDSNSPVLVKGFAVFVLEETVVGGGGDNQIIATFVKTVVPGEAELTATIHDFGAYGVRLVH